MDVVINATYDDAIPVDAHQAMAHAHQNILHALGYSREYPPVAELLKRYHGLSGDWLVASPIYWQATHNDGMLIACNETLDFGTLGAKHYFNVFSALMAEENIPVFFHDETTWLIQIKDKPPLKAKPPHDLIQQSFTEHLFALDDTLHWQRLITECQMAFNVPQVTSAQAQVNGVWFWGGGALLPRSARLTLANDQRLMSTLSSNVHAFDVQFLNQKDVLIFLEDGCGEQIKLIKTHAKNKIIRWHWNNVAYRTKASSWVARLLGRA